MTSTHPHFITVISGFLVNASQATYATDAAVPANHTSSTTSIQARDPNSGTDRSVTFGTLRSLPAVYDLVSELPSASNQPLGDAVGIRGTAMRDGSTATRQLVHVFRLTWRISRGTAAACRHAARQRRSR